MTSKYKHTTLIATAAIALLFAPACSGTIFGGGDSGDPGDSGRPGDGDGPDLEPPDCTDLGPPMLRRLTSLQLQNTVVRVFQDPSAPLSEVLTDPVVHGFRVDATEAVVRDLDSQQLMTYAERVAEWAVQQKLGQLSACQTLEPDCYRTFIESFGRRVYRRPVPPASVEAYSAMFAAEATFADGAHAVIAAMLQSPHFLYRSEVGEPDPNEPGVNRLTAYEVADNLAYTLTNHPPDEALLQAAEQGRLATPADLDREIDRLLATPEARATFTHFARVGRSS